MHGAESRPWSRSQARMCVRSCFDIVSWNRILRCGTGWSEKQTLGSTGIPRTKPLQGESGAEGHAWVKASREQHGEGEGEGSEVNRHYALLTYQRGSLLYTTFSLTLYLTLHPLFPTLSTRVCLQPRTAAFAFASQHGYAKIQIEIQISQKSDPGGLVTLTTLTSSLPATDQGPQIKLWLLENDFPRCMSLAGADHWSAVRLNFWQMRVERGDDNGPF